MKHTESLGGYFSAEERAGFMAVWRQVGYLLGIPETILIGDEKEALKLYEIGHLCEPPPDMASICLANGLINSAPLVAGFDEGPPRHEMAGQIYRISRALIGDALADELKFPPASTFGLLPLQRIRNRSSGIVEWLLPDSVGSGPFDRFAFLLGASAYDEAGISWEMPDHHHAEKSSKW